MAPLPLLLIRWQFRNPPIALASCNMIYDCMIVYNIPLPPNDYALMVCFGMLFHEVPRFPQKEKKILFILIISLFLYV